MNVKRIVGWIMQISITLMIIGVFIYGGIDGIRNGYDFWRLFARFIIIGAGVKAFDIICLDFILLTKTHFFQHYFPETEGCEGWKNFGYNLKEQLRQCIMIPICCVITALIFTFINCKRYVSHIKFEKGTEGNNG